MRSTFLSLAGLVGLVLTMPAPAQPPTVHSSAGAVCRVEAPKIPIVEWSGQATYRARSAVKDGRVVRIEITALGSGVDRRSQRSLVMAIQSALKAAPCEAGDHEFEQTFTFNIPKQPAAPASAATP